MRVRQLRTEELIGIWPQVAELTPYESYQELQSYAVGSEDLFITDQRGPAFGFLLLCPWKEMSNIFQIVTPRRMIPPAALLEHAVELSDEKGFGLITPLASPWSLRSYKRWGFRSIQRIHSYLKADHLLPPPIEWVELQPLKKCAGAASVSELDAECFVPFWQLSPTEAVRVLESELALGICSQGKLLGYVSAVSYGRQGSVGRLAVHPDFRREGIGGALLRAMIQELHRRGMVEISVTTQEENIPARNLYQSFGFFFQGEFEIMGYPYPRENEIWGL